MINVLIIDDEMVIREGLKKHIPWKDLGVDDVFIANDGIAALKVFGENQIDIILCDIKMPNLDGIEFLEKIFKIKSDCRILLISAYADKDSLKKALELNVSKLLEKPIQRKEVIEVIKKMVAEIQDERIRQRISNKETGIKQKIAKKLSQRVEDEFLIESSVQLKKEILKYKFYITIIISLKINGSLLEYDNDQLINSILELYDFSVGYIANEKTMVLHIMSNRDIEIDDQYLTSVLTVCKNFFNCDAKVFIAVGEQEDSIKKLYNSYNSAVMFLQSLFFLNYDNIVKYKEIDTEPIKFSESDFDKFEKILIGMNKKNIDEYLYKLKNEFVINLNTCPDNAKLIYFKLIHITNEVIKTLNITDENGAMDNDQYINIVWQAETLDEIHNYLINQIDKLFIIMSDENKKWSLANQIANYIDTNYTDSTLSLNKIANSVFATPTHICFVFKKKMGITIYQYIANLRINKAKILLQDRMLKLYEISLMVGYPNDNYFAKIFKKTVGITPSEYRERLR